MTTPKKFFATRDFKDAGSGKSFKAGSEVKGADGVLDNYEAAGLISDKEAKAAIPAEAAA